MNWILAAIVVILLLAWLIVSAMKATDHTDRRYDQ